MKKLKPYMVSDDEPYEGACLVFAHTVREAKKIGWSIVSSWGCDSFIEVRATFMRNSLFLYEQAIQENLEKGIPHVIESPITCKGCEHWGMKLNEQGYCDDCLREN
jgi:hypothetical protein